MKAYLSLSVNTKRKLPFHFCLRPVSSQPKRKPGAEPGVAIIVGSSPFIDRELRERKSYQLHHSADAPDDMDVRNALKTLAM
jgi:hypothetical protein